MVSDEDTLRRIFEQQGPATMRDADIDGYIKLWAGPDPIWCPQDIPDVRGLDAIRAAVAALFAEYDFTPTVTADTVAAFGSHGHVTGTARLDLRRKNDHSRSTVYTREVWLFGREAGQWKINCMVFNHKPAPH
jgi:ketosteroid isomerase-like protein